MIGADFTGRQFEQLTTLRLLEERHNGHRQYLCKCSCGKETKVTHNNLNSGNTKSCGCRHFTQDGMYKKHAFNRRWRNMMERCYQKSCKDYRNYGARGITVCERWHKFKNYIEDVIPSYIPGRTLDRIDNDKGYSPDNFEWATLSQQRRNQRPRNGRISLSPGNAERLGEV